MKYGPSHLPASVLPKVFKQKWKRSVVECSAHLHILFAASPPFDPHAADGFLEEPLRLYPRNLQRFPSLQALVPSLLRHEVEIALEKLDLTWDRTFAWEMFLDMMVRLS